MTSSVRRTRQQDSGLVFRQKPSRGLTIMELLIASAIALLMVAGLVTAFQVIGEQVKSARAVLEVSGQLRMGQHVIREDLANISAPVRPWLHPSDGEGYFEYVEGPMHDRHTPNSSQSIMGDTDDIVMFTARNELEPFRGRYRGNVIVSREAEIVIWTRWIDRNGDGIRDPGDPMTIHRKVLLVRPDLTSSLPAVSMVNFYKSNDVSVRAGSSGLVANSLADLTKRENRFGHATTFPFPINRGLLETYAQSRGASPPAVPADEANLGKDVVLSNVLAFDVQAYDPMVEVRADPNGFALLPHDNGYDAAAPAASSSNVLLGRGGYVDLNYVRYLTTVSAGASHFSDLPVARSGLRSPALRTYCTWSTHYENDGLDQDGDGEGSSPVINGLKAADGIDNDSDGQIDENIDEGTDGFDSDNANGVDDVRERETSPPYPVPLRGIKITIRLYEPDSQRVRQSSIIQDFIPE